MKKLFAVVLTMGLAISAVACGSDKGASSAEDAKSEGVMTYAEYAAADLDSMSRLSSHGGKTRQPSTHRIMTVDTSSMSFLFLRMITTSSQQEPRSR